MKQLLTFRTNSKPQFKGRSNFYSQYKSDYKNIKTTLLCVELTIWFSLCFSVVDVFIFVVDFIPFRLFCTNSIKMTVLNMEEALFFIVLHIDEWLLHFIRNDDWLMFIPSCRQTIMIYLLKWNHYKSARAYANQQICVEKHSISIFDEGKKRWFFWKILNFFNEHFI